MNGEKKRLDYLDVLKGILIIFVVYQHVFWLIGSNIHLSEDNLYSVTSNFSKYIFLSFYMPAFFIVTGFCSKFDGDFVPFLKKNVLSILWPSLALGFGVEWFIAAMFGGRIAYWFLNKYIKTDWVQSLILLAVGFVGILLVSFGFSVHFWYIPHILIMCFYLAVGVLFKRFEEIKVVYPTAALIFISLVGFCFFCNIDIPFVVSNVYVTPENYLLNVALSISGTITLWGICKLINKNRVLSFWGRNSLVIYLVHISILSFIIPFLKTYIINLQHNNIGAFAIVLILLAIALIISSIIVMILNMKHFRWITGKF